LTKSFWQGFDTPKSNSGKVNPLTIFGWVIKRGISGHGKNQNNASQNPGFFTKTAVLKSRVVLKSNNIYQIFPVPLLRFSG